jgi:predicted Rossmann-fold nucleotide-binding protein
MKVLVCGGRDYKDVERVFAALTKEHKKAPFTTLIHGGAKGADELAARWAVLNGVEVRAYPANWEAHGKAAGPLRNQRMLNEERPNMVIAFPGGRGTSDMISRAQAARVPVMQISGQSTKPKASTYRMPRMT